MSRTITAVIALLLAFTVLSAPQATQPPQEDEPGWNCATMGNRICGDK